MVLVWFSEMAFLGFPYLSRVWARLWLVPVPESSQLATALHLMWATGAPGKGALCAMATFGLFSRSASARTALFISMSSVPPLNIVFPFRQQGFPFGPVAVATTLSTILWGSFFLFRERARRSVDDGTQRGAQSRGSAWDRFQGAWFAAYAAAITVMALVFLFRPRMAVNITLPCMSASLAADDGALFSVVHASLASGTHLLAVATAFWIGAVQSRTNPFLGKALTVAGIVHAGLFCVFPLRQLALELGGSCARSSILVGFIPLFAAWLLFAVLAYRVGSARAAPLKG